MPLVRPRTFQSAFETFDVEIGRVRKLDAVNHARAQRPGLSASLAAEARLELHLASEGLFMRMFRHWERFLENAFLLAATDQRTASGRRARSFVRPRSKLHALDVIAAGRDVLSWSKPADVLGRATLFLRDGYPFASHIEAARSDLTNVVRIRNRIAHESDEAHTQYLKVLKSHFGTGSAAFVPPGRFLNLQAKGSTSHYLEHYAVLFGDLAGLIKDG